MCREILISSEPVIGTLREFQPLEIVNVNQTEYEAVWDEVVREYHYLGYDKMIGQRIKYLVLYKNKLIAAISYNRASLRIGVRDAYIGWDEKQRLEMLNQVVNNNRFLILPWVKIKNLASHLISHTLKVMQKDWYEQFGSVPFLAETFVDQERYKGICYLAANWLYLGTTKGYGKVGNTFVYHGNRKGVYIYVLQEGVLKSIQSESHHRTLIAASKSKPNMMLCKPDWSLMILNELKSANQSDVIFGNKLSEYLVPFRESINYSSQEVYAELFVKGFLSDLKYKSAEPIALRYGTSVRGSQRFLRDGGWDTKKMESIYQSILSKTLSNKNAMILLSENIALKKGVHTVGVARQYSESVKKTVNCQTGVFIGYSGAKGCGLIDRELYIPEVWFTDEYKSRRKDCEIPNGIDYKTKIEIAIAILKKITSTGLFPARWLSVDSFYGNDKDFLDSIPEGLWYLTDVDSGTLVFAEISVTKERILSKNGRNDLDRQILKTPVSVLQIAEDALTPWNIIGNENITDTSIICDKTVQVIKCEGSNPGVHVLLYICRLKDGSYKFTFCNAPKGTPIHRIRGAALKRQPFEQCFEECKNELGLNHCEGRSWNAWHRHTLLVFIAHLFLIKQRLV